MFEWILGIPIRTYRAIRWHWENGAELGNVKRQHRAHLRKGERHLVKNTDEYLRNLRWNRVIYIHFGGQP